MIGSERAWKHWGPFWGISRIVVEFRDCGGISRLSGGFCGSTECGRHTVGRPKEGG